MRKRIDELSGDLDALNWRSCLRVGEKKRGVLLADDPVVHEVDGLRGSKPSLREHLRPTFLLVVVHSSGNHRCWHNVLLAFVQQYLYNIENVKGICRAGAHAKRRRLFTDV